MFIQSICIFQQVLIVDSVKDSVVVFCLFLTVFSEKTKCSDYFICVCFPIGNLWIIFFSFQVELGVSQGSPRVTFPGVSQKLVAVREDTSYWA